MEYTSYYFNVISKHFEGALDIFAQFFNKPLFNNDAVFREVQAVDSEDCKNRILDGRRNLQVWKSLLDPAHPYSKFSTGNMKTLLKGSSGDVNETLQIMQAYYAKYYTPERMTLSLVGPQSVAELSRMAVEYFSGVTTATPSSLPSNVASKLDKMGENFPLDSVSKDRSISYPLKPGNEGTIIRIRPVKEIRDISIVWNVPQTRSLYRKKTFSLLAYMLSNKAPNSLHTVLQDKGWISSMSAGISSEFEDFSSFEVSFSLSPQGFENWEEIVSMMYEYLGVINTIEDNRFLDVWSEMKNCRDLEFRYQEKSDSISMASSLASNLNFYSLEHVVSVGRTYDNIDMHDISKMRNDINILLPEYSVIIQRNPDFESWISEDGMYGHNEDENINEPLVRADASVGDCANSVDTYYGVPFHKEKIKDEFLMRFTNAMKTSIHNFELPGKNRFIPSELISEADGESVFRNVKKVNMFSDQSVPLDVASEEVDEYIDAKKTSDPPVMSRSLHIPPQSELWHSKDQVFGFPRSVFVTQIRSNAARDGSPLNSLIGNIFSQLVARKYYQASQSGLYYSVSVGIDGLSLGFQGFSPKLPELVAEVSADFANRSVWDNVDENVFLTAKEKLLRTIKGWRKENMLSQAEGLLAFLLQQGVWLPEDRLKTADSLTLDDMHFRVKDLLETPTIISYLHGNLNVDSAEKVHVAVTNSLRFKKDLLPAPRFEIPPEIDYSRPNYLETGTHTVLALPSFNSEDSNNAMLTYMQADLTTPTSVARVLLLRSLLAEPLFTELRTKQQLGYIVGVTTSSFGRGENKSIRGLSFKVLSKRFSAIHCERALGKFLTEQRQIFKNYTDEDLKVRIDSIILSLNDPPKVLSDEAGEYWYEILENQKFEWKDSVIEALRQVTIADIVATGEKYVFDEATRASMSVLLFGNGMMDQLKEDIIFDKENDFFPYKDTSRVHFLRSIDDLRQKKKELKPVY